MELRWRHCILNARCSWLHGDPRGFRSRDHRIHSSGDYKHRPPAWKRAALCRYHEGRSDDPTYFSVELRVVMLIEFLDKLGSLQYRAIAASLGDSHLHLLAELPFDFALIRGVLGKCKQRASHAVRNYLPGNIWSAGGEFKWINGRDHLQDAYRYIRTRQERGTVVWSHRNDEN